MTQGEDDRSPTTVKVELYPNKNGEASGPLVYNPNTDQGIILSKAHAPAGKTETPSTTYVTGANGDWRPFVINHENNGYTSHTPPFYEVNLDKDRWNELKKASQAYNHNHVSGIIGGLEQEVRDSDDHKPYVYVNRPEGMMKEPYETFTAYADRPAEDDRP